MSHWYYSLDQEKRLGPVAETELRKIGEKNPNILIWSEGMAEWSDFHTYFIIPRQQRIRRNYIFLMIGIFVLGLSGIIFYHQMNPETVVKRPPARRLIRGLPQELNSVKTNYEFVRFLPLTTKATSYGRATRDEGFVFFSNLPSYTKFNIKIGGKTYEEVLIDNFIWMKDIEIPVGDITVQVKSQNLSEKFESYPGIRRDGDELFFQTYFRFLIQEKEKGRASPPPPVVANENTQDNLKKAQDTIAQKGKNEKDLKGLKKESTPPGGVAKIAAVKIPPPKIPVQEPKPQIDKAPSEKTKAVGSNKTNKEPLDKNLPSSKKVIVKTSVSAKKSVESKNKVTKKIELVEQKKVPGNNGKLLASFKKIFSDFEQTYQFMSTQDKKGKISKWKQWAPTWSRNWAQWVKQLRQDSLGKNQLYSKEIKLRDAQSDAFKEMQKKLLKPINQHGVIRSRISQIKKILN